MERHVKKIATMKDKGLAWRTLTILYRIIRNLSNSPTTANSLSTRSKALIEALNVDEFRTILLECGFVQEIQQFEEKWVCHHVSPVTNAKMLDLLPIIDSFLANLKPASAMENMVQEQSKNHRAYIDKMLQQAEEDRQMKLDAERRRIEKLKAQQEQRARDMEEQKLAFRKRIYGRSDS